MLLAVNAASRGLAAADAANAPTNTRVQNGNNAGRFMDSPERSSLETECCVRGLGNHIGQGIQAGKHDLSIPHQT